MTLYDFIKQRPEGTEIPVHDTVYDMETYFYNDEPTDDWDKAMERLAKLLTVVYVQNLHVTVNLSDVIEKHLSQLEEEEIFISASLGAIMGDIDSIFAGNVSESWLTRFVTILEQ